jgi:OmpA-OmpF porin, OOP family
MKIRFFSIVVVVLFAAGCTTAPGSTHNVEAVKLSNGREGWGVHCHGMFESSKTCFNAASKVCGDKPVHVIYAFDRLESGLGPKEDARDLVFMCDVPAQPVAKTSIPVAVAPGSPSSTR